jgi:hypothetical protein
MSVLNTTEKDIFAKDFTVGSVVYLRCIVTAITPAPPQPNTVNSFYGGSGDRVTVQVEVNGNIGEVSPGPIVTVSPVQCRATGATYQA